ncbi:MAG TPA: DUF5317 domain-containing protein [Firmicutes bacterium]|nr:DUF5317 domain-containing protein [Bacillota bacterium]
MFLEAAIIGAVIGLLRGGKLNRLGQINLSGWPLAVIALIIQLGLWVDYGARWNCLPVLIPYLHILSYLPLLAFVYMNRSQPGMYLFGLGLLLNLIVIASNGGTMPVDADKLAPLLREELLSGAGSPLHLPIDINTRLAFLGDVVRIPYGKHRMISAGDIALSIGLLHFIQQGIQKRRTTKKRGRINANF